MFGTGSYPVAVSLNSAGTFSLPVTRLLTPRARPWRRSVGRYVFWRGPRQHWCRVGLALLIRLVRQRLCNVVRRRSRRVLRLR